MIFSPPKTWPAWKLWCASNQVLCTYAEAVAYFDKVRAEKKAAEPVAKVKAASRRKNSFPSRS